MLNLKIALRFLVHKPLKSFVTILSIAAGSAIFYFVFNISDGLNSLVLNLTAEVNSHIAVTGEFNYDQEGLNKQMEIRDYIFRLDDRVSDISYSYVASATYKNGKGNMVPISLKGMDFETGENIHNVKQRILSRKYNKTPKPTSLDSKYSGEIVVGSMLTKNLGYKDMEDAVGKDLKLSYNGTEYLFKIVAAYSSNQESLSYNTIFTHFKTVQRLTGKEITNIIDLETKNALDSSKVLKNIKPYLVNTYGIDNINLVDWQEGNSYVVNALYIEDVSIFIIQIFTAFSITFGVASILTFNIKDKFKQIGILKAMGTSNSDTRKIFIWFAVILTIVGIFVGLIIGVFSSRVFMKLLVRPQTNRPLVAIKSNLFNVFSLYTFLIMGLGNIFASLIPIKQATKLKIIEVIKND